MSLWHEELELALLNLEDSKASCDVMTYVISHILAKSDIPHQCRVGFVETVHSKTQINPHCWIELKDGWGIDLTLRRWLGDEDRWPHGVFRLSEYPQVQFWGTPLFAPKLDDEEINAMSDHLIETVKIPVCCSIIQH
ncbi:TPA: hypothetical protein LQ491_004772 [Salmonella enterica subsp. enterica serovar Derby]|nr:hypothetical protein [Salmonella enterica subsp. enterica serovar Derby]HBL4076268.1 hypothetical protein [Salmonella enterica subsp. enterica serovar Derby]